MSRRYRVVHVTEYSYSEPVTLCHNETRMTPLQSPNQACGESRITVSPTPEEQVSRTDFFGNAVNYFGVEQPHEQLRVEAHSIVDTGSGRNQQDFATTESWETVRLAAARAAEEHFDPRQFLLQSALIPDPGEAARDLIEAAFQPGRAVIEAVAALNHAIATELEFDPVATSVSTPLADVLKDRRGVCQDFAHVAIACLRKIGLPAAYVSGYLETDPPPGQEKLVGSDASHAWFAVYVPGCGWLEFDPTNDQVPDDRYVTVARGRDYRDVAPLKGVVFGGGAMNLHVAVDVLPVRLEAVQ